MGDNSEDKEKLKRKKRKNGIWLSDSTALDLYAQERAAKMQKVFEDIIFYGITIPMQLMQTIGVFVISFINDSFMELSFFLVGFFFTRTLLGETFHLNCTVSCTTSTWAMFYVVTAFIPSIYISVFLCIVLGCGLSIYMHYIVVKEEEKCPKG